MKHKRYLFALVLAGMALASCSQTGSVGVKYDDIDLDIDTPWVEYSVPVTKVNFAEGQQSITVHKGEEYTYDFTVEPAKASKRVLIWESSDESIATVTDGVVSAKEAGHASITVSGKEGLFTPINLDVEVDIPLEDISFASSTVAADFNHSYQLSVDYKPTDTTQKGVSWKSSNEELATVDENGLVTTYAQTGHATIYAESAYINKSISIDFEIADRTIYPTKAIIDSYDKNVEIGHNFTIVAHSESDNPEIAPTHPEMTYYSTNPEVLSVEETTGVAHALNTGDAKVYAKASNGLESEKKDVHVFEVKVASINLEDITLSNRNGRDNVKVEFTYETDTPGFDQASAPNFVYSVLDESVAKVDTAGLMYALVDFGETDLTVTDTRSGVSKTAHLTVKYDVDTVSIKGTGSVLVGGTTQLSVITNPSGVPSSYVSYESKNESIATVSAMGVVTGMSEGTTTIVASVLGHEAQIEVTVTMPDYPFAYGSVYVVGSANYASGESKASSTGSWDKANQAREIKDVVQQPHDNLLYEKRTIIKFNEGDIWKLRTADYYLEIDGYISGTYRIGEYKTSEGAFAGENPDMSVTEDNNIKVNRTGYYAIYDAQYSNEHPEGWYSIYVGRYELRVSDSAPQVQVGHAITFEAHDWAGDLNWNYVSGEEYATVTRNDYKFTVVAGDVAGVTIVHLEDKWTSVDVTITVTEDAPLPKDFEANIPYVVGNADYHTGEAQGKGEYWGSDASKANKLVVSSEPLDPGVVIQYETTINFKEENEFKVVIGGDSLYWDLSYQTTEGAFAKSQMSKPDNVVVKSAGAYKIYVKCLDNNRGWQVYVAAKSGGDQPTSYDYYLKGTFNNWESSSEYKFLPSLSDTNIYTLENVSIHATNEMKGFKEENNWYGVAKEYEDCGWTVGNDNNCVVSEDGVYTVTLYIHSDDGNHLAITKTGELEPQPPVEEVYYLKGDFNQWKENQNFVFTCKGEDTNILTLENVTIHEGEAMKGYKEVGNWYGVAKAYDGCGWTVGNNGDCVVSADGIYTVTLYIHSDDGNHIAITKTGEIDPEPVVEGNYYLKGTFNEWKQSPAYKMSIDPHNKNHYILTDVTIHAEEAMKVYKPAEGQESEAWYGVAQAYEGCGWTVGSDNNCVVSASGIYTVNLYLDATNGNYITIEKTGNVPEPFDDSKVTKINIIDEPGVGFTGVGKNIRLHIFDITWAAGSPITSVAGLEEAEVAIGAAVWYNAESGTIDTQMNWVKDGPTEYTVTLPAYIESCKMCIYNNDSVWVHQVHFNEKGESYIDGESTIVTTSRGVEYNIYFCNSYDPSYNAWIGGSNYNTPMSITEAN